jgi:plasmid stabilization system protein ParE
MVTPHYEVLWSDTAKKQVKAIYDHIRKDSLQNAEKVVADIAATIEKLCTNPEHLGPDKYRKNNDGSYRYFELHHYRVAFRIYKTNVRVLRVRSTYQEPLEY